MPSALTGTPLWVWPLLGWLLWTGFRALRGGPVRAETLAILPAFLLAASAWSVLTGPESGADTVLAWAASVALGVASGMAVTRRTPIAVSKGALVLPGTPLVLALSLAFFAVQYWAGHQRATAPASLLSWPFRGVAPVASGLAAGFFTGRAALLWSRARNLPR